jgi:hypothetical protein
MQAKGGPGSFNHLTSEEVMRFNGANQRLQFDKWYDHLYPIGAGGGIEQEVDQTLFVGGISQDQLWAPDEALALAGSHALWVWAHGNRHRDAIAAGPGEMLTPGGLAKQIAGKLAKAATGHIVVWSCWAGSAGGFAEHFAAFMVARGYNNLHVWGATVVTGVMVRSDENQWANVTVWADQANVNVGLDLAGGPGGLAFGGSRLATQADMKGFGPGLAVPNARGFDV